MVSIDCIGKHALVCGSTQGIGKAIAIELAAAGATVVLAARNEESLKRILAELPTPHDQQHLHIVADFSVPQTVHDAVHRFLESHGTGFHILINNTGGPPPGAITEASADAFVQTFSQHLVCNQLLVQLLLPFMQHEQYGRIVNIISTSVKQPIANLGVSNTVRGAVASWAKTLSFEVAQFGITVNNILPGYITTGRLTSLVERNAERLSKAKNDVEAGMKAEIPAKRFGAPEEIAHLAAFLASPLASYITGTSIAVDGGRTTAL